MNIMNVFWAFFAEIAGLVISWVLWTVMSPLMNVMVESGSSMWYLGNLSLLTMTILLCIVFPVMTLMSDEEGGAFKKLITSS